MSHSFPTRRSSDLLVKVSFKTRLEQPTETDALAHLRVALSDIALEELNDLIDEDVGVLADEHIHGQTGDLGVVLDACDHELDELAREHRVDLLEDHLGVVDKGFPDVATGYLHVSVLIVFDDV